MPEGKYDFSKIVESGEVEPKKPDFSSILDENQPGRPQEGSYIKKSNQGNLASGNGFAVRDPYAGDNPGQPITNPFKTFAETVRTTFARQPGNIKTTEAMMGSLSLDRMRQMRAQILAQQSASYDPEARQYLNKVKEEMRDSFGRVISPEEAEEILPKIEMRINQKSEAVNKALQYAISSNANINQKEMVDRLSKIDNPMDFVNYLSNATGEAISQIPLSILTYGASSFVQSAGDSYLTQVQDIAEKEGITIQQVINKGLDEPAIAAANAQFSAALDRIGAGKIHQNLSKSFLKNQFRKKTLGYAETVLTEAGTEAVQTGLEQRGGMQEINWADIGEAAVKGGLGSSVISSPSLIPGSRGGKETTVVDDVQPVQQIVNKIDTEKERISSEKEAKIERAISDITGDLDQYMNDDISMYDKETDELASELNPENAPEIEVPEQNDPVLNIDAAQGSKPLSAFKDLGIISNNEEVLSWAEENGISINIEENIPDSYGSFDRHNPSVINLNRELLSNSPKKLVDQVVAHEVVHAMVDRGLRNAATRNTVWGELGQLKSTYLDNKSLEGAPQGVLDMMDVIQDQNKLGEIITYSLTDPDVAKWMDSIEVVREKGSDIKTLWQSIKESVRRLAESIGVSGTALDKVTDILDKYTDFGTQDQQVEQQQDAAQAVEPAVQEETAQEVALQPEAQEDQEIQTEEVTQQPEVVDEVDQEAQADMDRVLDLMEQDDMDFQDDADIVEQQVEESPEIAALPEQDKAERNEMMQEISSQAATLNRTQGAMGKRFQERKLNEMITEYNQFAEERNIPQLSAEEIATIKETGAVARDLPQQDILTDDDIDFMRAPKKPMKQVDKIVDVANRVPVKMNKSQFSSFIERANVKLPEGSKISPESAQDAWSKYSEQTTDAVLESKRKELLKKANPATYKKKGGKFPKGKIHEDAISKLEEIHKIMNTVTLEEAHNEVSSIMGGMYQVTDMKSGKASKIIGESGKRIDVNELTPEQLSRIESLKFAGVKNMDEGQLDFAISEINSLVADGKTKFRKKQEAEKALVEDMKQEAANIISGGKGLAKGDLQTQAAIKEREGKAKELLDTEFFVKADSWDSLLDKLSVFDKGSETFESNLNKMFGDLAQETQLKADAGRQDATFTVSKKLNEIFGKKARKTLMENKTQKEEFYFDGVDGDPVVITMTANEAYKKWMEAQDPSLDGTFKAMGLDRNSVSKVIESQLDPKLIEWAKWQLEEFYPKYYDSINKVFREEFGYNLPKNDFYSPIQRELDDDTGDTNLLEFESPLESALNSSLYSRQRNNKNLRLIDGDEVMARYIAKMEHFKAWNRPVSIMRKTLMSPDVKRTIALHHGKAYNEVISNFVNDWARGGISQEMSSKLVDTIRKNYTVAAIGLKLPIFFKQLTSIPAYAAEIPVASFAAGTADFFMNPKKAIDTLSKTTFLKERIYGGFDKDMKLAMTRDSSRYLAGGKTWQDKMMFLTKWGDAAAIYVGGWPVYKHWYDKTLRETGSKTKAEKVAEQRFVKATRMSQQSSTIGDLSYYQRAGSFGKLFTMFMTVPMQYLRHASLAYRNLKHGRGSKKQNLKRLAMYHFVLPTFFSMMNGGFKGLFAEEDMEEEEREEILWKYFKQSVLGSMNGIYFFGPLADNMIQLSSGNYYKYNATPLGAIGGDVASSLASLGSIVEEMAENGELDFDNVFKASKEIVDVSGKVAGIAAPGVVAQVEGAYNSYMRDDLPAWDRLLIALGWSPYSLGIEDK